MAILYASYARMIRRAHCNGWVSEWARFTKGMAQGNTRACSTYNAVFSVIQLLHTSLCAQAGITPGGVLKDGTAVPLVAFADDECVYKVGNKHSAQSVLDLFAEALKWTVSTMLQVPKCVSFGFGLNDKGAFGPLDPQLTLYGRVIKWVGDDLDSDYMFKYVGMWIHSSRGEEERQRDERQRVIR